MVPTAQRPAPEAMEVELPSTQAEIDTSGNTRIVGQDGRDPAGFTNSIVDFGNHTQPATIG